MTWPNSVSTARPLPGVPSTFPGVPANDNWRMPRTNYRPPAPANDNFPQKPGRGLKLPGVSRLLPWFAVGYAIGELIFREDVPAHWVHSSGYVQTRDCPIYNPLTIGGYRVACGSSNAINDAVMGHTGPGSEFLATATNGYALYERTGDAPAPGWGRYQLAEAWQRQAGEPVVAPEYVPASNRAIAVRPARLAPHPMFYPPLLNPPAGAAPPVKPGKYIGPKQIMGEWPDSGYSAPNQPVPVAVPRYLPSHRPPARTKERKVRAKDYAVGRTIEWLVSQATEGLDFQRALFEALPWWRKIALYNAARQLETRYADGRIVAGRLHYRDLTPIEKAQAIYDYIDEIDAAKAVENAVKMQLTDMFWAEIGQRMGRYQTGPWDDHGFDGPPKPEPEWEWYIPDIAPDTTHNHWTYETLVNKRLTQQEAERIHKRFDQFRSAPYQERKFR